jgi:hypothetical protein
MKVNKSNFKKFLQSIFKIFFYTIFKLKHGKIVFNEKIQSKLYKEENVSFEDKSFTLKYSIFFSSNSRLYTDRIHDTAIIKNNLLIDKPSFQLRNNVNDDDVTKNIVLKNGTPYIMRKLNGTILSLLTGGGGNDNFFHWLFDVLPRIGIVEKKINLNEIDYFLCPNLNKWQLETLNLLGIKKSQCLSSVKYRHIRSDQIIITTHPWQISKNVLKDIENLPIWISEWLKKKFLSHKSHKDLPKKFYIDRSDSKSNLKNFRYIINENELKNFLKDKGFEFVRLSELSFREELKIFNNAETVVGLQGAGLTNLIWSNNKTKIIELRSNLTNKLYENLAKENKINFDKLESTPKDYVVADHYGSIEVDIKKLEKIL